MNELKIPRETENHNESQELKNLLNKLNLEMENHALNRPNADNFVTNRLEMRKPAIPTRDVLPANDFNKFSDLDSKYLEKLNYDLKECNPNYNLARQWKVNCQRCVPTFEMRRRGYDVTTLPRGKGWDTLSYNPFQVWKNPEVIRTSGNGMREIETQMSKWGEGSRAEIVVMWKGAPSGHAFFAERVNGKTRFYDPQNGSADVSKYFERVEPGSVRFCRIDNLEPNEKINDCCKWRV